MNYRAKVFSAAYLLVTIVSFNCSVMRITLFTEKMLVFMSRNFFSIKTTKVFYPSIMIIKI